MRGLRCCLPLLTLGPLVFSLPAHSATATESLEQVSASLTASKVGRDAFVLPVHTWLDFSETARKPFFSFSKV